MQWTSIQLNIIQLKSAFSLAMLFVFRWWWLRNWQLVYVSPYMRPKQTQSRQLSSADSESVRIDDIWDLT